MRFDPTSPLESTVCPSPLHYSTHRPAHLYFDTHLTGRVNAFPGSTVGTPPTSPEGNALISEGGFDANEFGILVCLVSG